MKYKVGDKVKIKSLEWYNKYKDKDGLVFSINGTLPFNEKMAKYCWKDFEIEEIIHGDYVLSINDGSCFYFEDWMLEDEPTVSDQLKEKRFHAACSAMNGIVSGLMQSDEWHGWTEKYIAERAYLLADELLKQGGFTQ